MNKLLLVCFVFGIFLLTSCSRQFNLKEDLVLNEVFADKEIPDVQRIIDFVDKRVIEVTGQDDIDKAYHICLRKLDENDGNFDNLNQIFTTEEKLKLKECINPSVASAFWIPEDINPSLILTTRDCSNKLEYSCCAINPIGRFQAYLKRKGEQDQYYRNLYISILKNGDLSRSDAEWFPKHHREFDFEEPQARLWCAIYLLRVSECFQMTKL